MSKLIFYLFFIFIERDLAVDPSTSKSTFSEIILDRIDVLFEAPETMKWDVKIKKINKTKTMIGSIILYINLGDNCKLEVKGLKKQGKYVYCTKILIE